MPRRILVSHQWRTLGVATFAVLLSVILTGLFSYLDFLDYARAELRDDIHATATAYRAVLDGHFAEHSAALRNLATSPRVKGVYADPATYESQVEETFLRLQATHRDVQTVVLGLKDGRFYEFGPRAITSQEYDPRTRPWYVAGVALEPGQATVSPLFQRVDDDSWIATIVTPVTDENGEFIGVAGLMLDMWHLDEVNAAQNIDDNTTAFVAQGERVFIHQDKSLIGHPIPNKDIKYLSAARESVSAQVLDCGDNCIAESIFLPDTGLTVWVTGSESALLTSFWDSIREIVLASLLVVLAVFIMLRFAMVHLNKDVRELVRVANYIADGDLTVRAIPSLSVEFRDLAGSMNTMAATIEAHSRELERTIEQLRNANRDMIVMLSNAIEASDVYTQGHCDRVVAYAVKLGEALGFDDERTEGLRTAGMVHDVGKIGVPGAILNKPGKLDPEEWAVMQTHSAIGAKILRDSASLSYVSDIVLQHHEWFSGQGYPAGLRGEDILLEARVLAIADAYDAMVIARPYRKEPLSPEAAQRILREGAGTQFDPELVELFISLTEGEVPCGMPEADC